MITKFKQFENRLSHDKYMIGNDMFFMNDLFDYLYLDIEYPEDSVVIPVSRYDIDVLEFVEEVILDKFIVFTSVNRPKNNPKIEGVVEEVDQLLYQDEFYIRVKIKDDKSIEEPDVWNGWYLISNDIVIFVIDYDADKKPLHEEVKIKKEAEKYNL